MAAQARDLRGTLDAKRLTPAVRAQLLTISGATIDRLLKPTKDADRPKGLSATKAGPLLRNSITVRKAGDEHEQARDSSKRTYKSNDNAHVEQKNGDVVRRHAFHYRYDTATELKLLNALYAVVRVRLNLFTATTKATGWRSNKHGKKTRVYDKPRTPYQRVIDAGILTEAKAAGLAQLMETTNPADLTRAITTTQNQLIALAAAKTPAQEASSTRAQTGEASTTLSRAS